MQPRSDLARYAALIDGLIVHPLVFVPEAETETAVQVERGVVYPQALKSQTLPSSTPLDRLLDLAQAGRIDAMIVLDRHGHRRPFYRSPRIPKRIQMLSASSLSHQLQLKRYRPNFAPYKKPRIMPLSFSTNP
jgi:hypothetical protein